MIYIYILSKTIYLKVEGPIVPIASILIYTAALFFVYSAGSRRIYAVTYVVLKSIIRVDRYARYSRTRLFFNIANIGVSPAIRVYKNYIR